MLMEQRAYREIFGVIQRKNKGISKDPYTSFIA